MTMETRARTKHLASLATSISLLLATLLLGMLVIQPSLGFVVAFRGRPSSHTLGGKHVVARANTRIALSKNDEQSRKQDKPYFLDDGSKVPMAGVNKIKPPPSPDAGKRRREAPPFRWLRWAGGGKRNCDPWWKDNNELDDDKYWSREDIHTLGNTGLGGGLHAAMAPLSTKIIDLLAYNGTNVRNTIANSLLDRVSSDPENTKLQRRPAQGDATATTSLRILDLGCGVGMSTSVLASAARDLAMQQFAISPAGPLLSTTSLNATIFGVDTSPEMLAMARAREVERKSLQKLASCSGSSNSISAKQNTITMTQNSSTSVRFVAANAEATPFASNSFDLITIQFVMHEVPFVGRHRILREARRLLRPGGLLAVADICPSYEPHPSMVAGEPYVHEYQKNFEQQLSRMRGFQSMEQQVMLPGHVVLYTRTKARRRWAPANGWIRRASEFFHLHSYVWSKLTRSSSAPALEDEDDLRL